MSVIRRILKNSGVIVLGNVIDVVCALIATILLAHYFSQNDFGKISFLGVFFFLLSVVDSVWVRPVVIREVARNKSRSSILLGNTLLLRGVLTVIVLIFFWITMRYGGKAGGMGVLAGLVSCNIILGAYIFFYETICRLHLRMGLFVKARLVSNSLSIMMIAGVIFFKGSLFHFFLLSLIPGLVLVLLIRHYLGQLENPSFQLDPVLWREVFVKGWFLGLSALFIFIYHRIDQVMLFHLRGADETGLYAACVRAVEVLGVVPLALMSSLAPFMTTFNISSKELFKRSYRMSFKYLLIFIIPVAFGSACFFREVIGLLYGQSYVLAGNAFVILVFAEIFVFLGIVNNAILVATDKQRLDPVFTGLSVLVNIILNIVLIPVYGLTGAAAASLAAYATGPVMGLFIPSTREYSLSMVYYSIKPLCASLVMFSFNYFFHLALPVALVASVLVYLIMLFFINGFNMDEINFLKLLRQSSRSDQGN